MASSSSSCGLIRREEEEKEKNIFTPDHYEPRQLLQSYLFSFSTSLFFILFCFILTVLNISFFCLGRRPSSFIFAWFLLVCSCFVKTGKRNPRLMSRLERKGQCGARAQFKLSFCCSLNRPKTKSNNNNSNHFFFREWYNEAAIYRLGSTGHADVTLGASFFLICFDSRSCHVTLIQSARNQQVSGRIFFYEILSEGGGILRKMIYSHSNNRTCVYCLDNKTRRSPGEVDSCFFFTRRSNGCFFFTLPILLIEQRNAPSFQSSYLILRYFLF